jgi:hypothetical protein
VLRAHASLVTEAIVIDSFTETCDYLGDDSVEDDVKVFRAPGVKISYFAKIRSQVFPQKKTFPSGYQ